MLRRVRLIVGLAVVLSLTALVWPVSLSAQRLPLNRYSVADGLAHDRVKRITQDSKGFLWFSTSSGLSRFDGTSFLTFSTGDGLPHSSINDFFERRDGSYWVGTNGGGAARLVDRGVGQVVAEGNSISFRKYSMGDVRRSDRVNRLFEDRTSRLWAGTDGGLFLLAANDGEEAFVPVPLTHPTHEDISLQVWTFAEDRNGVLWIGTSAGLVKRTPDGRNHWVPVAPAGGFDSVNALLIDDKDQLWIGHGAGVVTASLTAPVDRMIASGRWLTSRNGLPAGVVQALARSRTGHVWIATTGLAQVSDGGLQTYERSHGLNADGIIALHVDDADNLWMGTYASGVMKLVRNGFTTHPIDYGATSGSLFAGLSGEPCVLTRQALSCFDGARFSRMLPHADSLPHGGRRAYPLLDHLGEFWLPTGDALLRFASDTRPQSLAKGQPKAVYKAGRELLAGPVTHLFEDSRGDIWIGSWWPDTHVLTRWERRTDRFQHYSAADKLPPFSAPGGFAEDSSGAIWIPFREGGLARYRNGTFELFGDRDGVPAGELRRPYVDRAGRLWVGSATNGVVRIDDPTAERPLIRSLSVGQGLTSNSITVIAEDTWGRMYLGTNQGVDRLDLSTGRVVQLSAAHGLGAIEVNDAMADRFGALWFLTYDGASRLVPEPPTQEPPAMALISAVRLSGGREMNFGFGVSDVPRLTFRPGERQVEIEFFALNVHRGEGISYQHKLEGADSDWGAPTTQRVVNYANLAPGGYRFVVRAVTGGRPGPAVATVPFTLMPPIWQRWWFLSTGLALALVGAYGASRYRLARQLELERIRTRIATDLHDDIGSTLSQIAILSEVVRRQSPAGGRTDDYLSKISHASREVVDAMGDIVWAISPKRDSLRDLTARMRRFASDTLTGAGIAFRFDIEGTEQNIKLGADLRRDVFLIFKESINNLVRHARATSAEIDFRAHGQELTLRIADDGCGFDPALAADGHGLASLRARALKLDGRLDVQSQPGQGTEVVLSVPLRRRRRSSINHPPE